METITIEDRLAMIEKEQKIILEKLDILSKRYYGTPIDFTQYPWAKISLPSFKGYNNTSNKPISLL